MRRNAALWAGTLAAAAAMWALQGRWYAAAALVSMVLLRKRPVGRQGRSVGRRRRVWTEAERSFILARDGWRCVRCGAREELQIDHVIPFSRGGACSVENAQVLCGPCNRAKGAS